jgi:hypothetical protein
MTIGIKTSSRHERLLYLYTTSSNDTSLKTHYKQYCKILARVIKEAKKCTYNNQINKSTNKIKTTWNIIKKETNRHKRLNNVTNYVNSPEDFNNYFITISENIIKNITSNGQNYNTCSSSNHYASNRPHRVFSNMNFKNTSTKEIETIIRSLKTKESHGYDEITTRILKISAPFISFPLTYIFNKAMIAGVFPSRLKYKNSVASQSACGLYRRSNRRRSAK